jgi:hypothetical protein
MHTMTAPQRSADFPHTLPLDHPHRASLLERTAMRIGIQLLIWSTRMPRLAQDRDEYARIRRNHTAREARESSFARRALLSPRQ